MIQIPTTKNIIESIEKDLKAKLDLPEDELRKVLSVLSAVVGGQIKLVYLRILDVQRNLYPDTADSAVNGGELERLGLIYLNRTPNPATAGVYTISINGENNTSIRANLTFKSNEDSTSPGNLYVTDEETILTGTDDTVEIRSFDGGTDFELQVGDELTITEPVIGAEQTVTVTAIVEEPKEAETEDAYRQAIIDAIQLEPQGGSRTDYRLWASDAQGVRKVYPYVKSGEAGTVQVYVEATILDSSDGEGTPSQAILDDVEQVILFDPDDTKPTNERGRVPIQTILEVLPIVLVPVDVTITGLDEDTATIRSAIEENLKAYLLDVRPYISGADLSRNKNDILYAARLQSVVTDVLESSNFFTDFVMAVNGVASTSDEFSGANIPYLRDLTFE
nr:baseplate J/gp47 family protein [uncultured Allomuricauda sp.]